MSTLLKNYLADMLIPIQGGNETIRNFYDEQKWISSDYKMSIPGNKNNQKEVCFDVEIKPFSLLQFPVTIDFYDFIINERTTFSIDGFPVVNASWHDAILFL